MTAEAIPTLLLTADEYERLRDAVYVAGKAPQNHVVEDRSRKYWLKRVRGLFLLMRSSGLSIQARLTRCCIPLWKSFMLASNCA